MNTLRLFKVSALKIPAKVGQKEADTSVSVDEF